jgi:hypothetical protein
MEPCRGHFENGFENFEFANPISLVLIDGQLKSPEVEKNANKHELGWSELARALK